MEQAKRQAETDMLQFRRYLGIQKAESAAEEERRTRLIAIPSQSTSINYLSSLNVNLLLINQNGM